MAVMRSNSCLEGKKDEKEGKKKFSLFHINLSHLKFWLKISRTNLHIINGIIYNRMKQICRQIHIFRHITGILFIKELAPEDNGLFFGRKGLEEERRGRKGRWRSTWTGFRISCERKAKRVSFSYWERC